MKDNALLVPATSCPRPFGGECSVKLDEAAFGRMLSLALDDLPAWVLDRLDNVVIVTEAWPSPQQMRASTLGRSGLLLGLYEGVPLTKRSRGYHLTPPDRITLFWGPLALQAQNQEQLVHLIRRTISHEIAHHFGFSENQVREAGL